jgi:hypothetical protein
LIRAKTTPGLKKTVPVKNKFYSAKKRTQRKLFSFMFFVFFRGKFYRAVARNEIHSVIIARGKWSCRLRYVNCVNSGSMSKRVMHALLSRNQNPSRFVNRKIAARK